MRKVINTILVLILFASALGGCTIYEDENTETIQPPQRRDSLVIVPWEPHPEQPDIPPIGH